MKCTAGLLAGLALVATVAVPARSQDVGNLLGGGHAHKDKKDKQDKGDKSAAIDLGLPEYHGPKRRIAVMSAESTAEGVPPEFAAGLSNSLVTALVSSDRFTVLEREEVDKIMKEQALGASGAVTPKSAAQLGKLMGAELFVKVAITEFTDKENSDSSHINIPVFGGRQKNRTAMVGLDVRLYNTTTGEIIDSVHATGEAKSSGGGLNFNYHDVDFGGDKFNSSPMGKATRDAVKTAVTFIVNKMDKTSGPVEWGIADMDSGSDGKVSTIYVAAGSAAGLKVGDTLEIFTPGADIKDPKTGEVLDRKPDKVLGHCKVTSVKEKIAIAEPVDGDGYSKKDSVRIASNK